MQWIKTRTAPSPGDESTIWSTTIAPAYNTAYTDTDGNYQLSNIYYGASGTNFTVTPSKPDHTFSPTSQNVTLLDATPTGSGVEFYGNQPDVYIRVRLF